MVNSSTVIIAALIALGPALVPAPDATQTARNFLEAFASNPTGTDRLFTRDAIMAVGDIGGPVSDFLKMMPGARWLRACRVTSLAEKAAPEAELSIYELPPQLRGGKISLFVGAYTCTESRGVEHRVRFTVALKNDQVAQFQMNPRE